jgi:hypothetical protein
MLTKEQVKQIKFSEEEVVINIMLGAENHLMLDVGEKTILGIDGLGDSNTEQEIEEHLEIEASKLQSEIKRKCNIEIEIEKCWF